MRAMGSAGGRWETSSSAYGSWWAAQKAEREAQLRLQPPAAALQAAPLGPAGPPSGPIMFSGIFTGLRVNSKNIIKR